MRGFAFHLDAQGYIHVFSPATPLRHGGAPSPWQSLDIETDQGRLFFLGRLYGLACTTSPDTGDHPAAEPIAALRNTPTEKLLLLPGVHAGAYWSQRRLTLWREASGLQSLYYAPAPEGGWLVSTRLSTLAARLDRQPGDSGLHEYLHLLDIAPPKTIYPGIYAVAAGQSLVLQPGGASAQPCSAVLNDADPSHPVDLPEAIDALEQRLTGAITACLQDAERPAAFLSSGVDSSLICALAAQLRPDLTAITVGFDAGQDESTAAAAIARHLGIKHEVWRFTRREVIEALPRYAQAADQPMADPAVLPSVLAFGRAAERFDVVLDGTGADELLGAMPPRHLRVAVEWASMLPRPARHGVAWLLSRLPGGYAPVFDFDHPAEVLRRWKGFSAVEIAQLCGEPVDLAQTAFYREYARFSRQDHFWRYSALYNAMPCDRLGYAARTTGLDVRFPFWMPALAGWLQSLPLSLRWQPQAPKYLLRLLLARHIPAALWDGPKRGFDPPLHDWLTDPNRSLLQQHLLAADSVLNRHFPRERVSAYVARYLAGERPLVFRLWALVILSAWLTARRRTDVTNSERKDDLLQTDT